jgi:hypothetical protein
LLREREREEKSESGWWVCGAHQIDLQSLDKQRKTQQKKKKKKSFLFYNVLIFIFPFLTSQPHLLNPFKVFQVSNFGTGIVGSLNL